MAAPSAEPGYYQTPDRLLKLRRENGVGHTHRQSVRFRHKSTKPLPVRNNLGIEDDWAIVRFRTLVIILLFKGLVGLIAPQSLQL